MHCQRLLRERQRAGEPRGNQTDPTRPGAAQRALTRTLRVVLGVWGVGGLGGGCTGDVSISMSTQERLRIQAINAPINHDQRHQSLRSPRRQEMTARGLKPVQSLI